MIASYPLHVRDMEPSEKKDQLKPNKYIKVTCKQVIASLAHLKVIT
jgi:hypothetical protein